MRDFEATSYSLWQIANPWNVACRVSLRWPIYQHSWKKPNYLVQIPCPDPPVQISAAVKVWNHLDKSIKRLKTFKNKVKLNILETYCSWVFNWSLLLLFLFLIVINFFLSSFFFLTNNLLCLSFSANMHPIFKHYLLLLG